MQIKNGFGPKEDDCGFEYFVVKNISSNDIGMHSYQISDHKINTRYKRDIRAAKLDLFTMDGLDQVQIGSGAGVFTVHALEQLGPNFGPFIREVCAARPDVCVHLEPIVELYDDNLEFDQYALKYHQKRNYLDGFLNKLNNLEARGKIEIVNVRRTGFGSTYQEAYTLVVWRVI